MHVIHRQPLRLHKHNSSNQCPDGMPHKALFCSTASKRIGQITAPDALHRGRLLLGRC